jgi:hypothetical protein
VKSLDALPSHIKSVVNAALAEKLAAPGSHEDGGMVSCARPSPGIDQR